MSEGLNMPAAAGDQMTLAPVPEPTLEERLRLAELEATRARAEADKLREKLRRRQTAAPPLSSEAKRLRAALVKDRPDLENDPALALLLRTTLEAFDDMRRAQAALAVEGETYRDKWGKPKPHPAIVARRDARSQFLHGIKALNLDLEPLEDAPGRPRGT